MIKFRYQMTGCGKGPDQMHLSHMGLDSYRLNKRMLYMIVMVISDGLSQEGQYRMILPFV